MSSTLYFLHLELTNSFRCIFPPDKMCIPDLLHQACLDLVENTPSTYATIRCVPARDRMECLDKVKDREADFLAVDPEDMYVAFQLPNQDFSVFSEIRTVVEPDGKHLKKYFFFQFFIRSCRRFVRICSAIPLRGHHFGAQELGHTQSDRIEWQKIVPHRLRSQRRLQNSHHQIEKSRYFESVNGSIDVTGREGAAGPIDVV